MTRATTNAELPFRFIGGNPGFDLVNTVDWASDGPVNDRLTDYEHLIAWAREGRLIGDDEATRRLRRAATRPAEAKAAHEKALALRGTLQQLITALARGGPNAPGIRTAIAALNPFVAEACGHLRLGVGARGAFGPVGVVWEWDGAPDRLDAVLWPVVRSVGEVLVSDEVPRFRSCAGEDCGWVYIDRSRNGLRRWCEMATCGTTAKSRRRRARTNA